MNDKDKLFWSTYYETWDEGYDILNEERLSNLSEEEEEYITYLESRLKRYVESGET